jgi:hypothetical protein
VLATHDCAVVTLPAFQNNLGWPLGILRPSIVLVADAEKIAMDAEPVLDASAALVAVTVTVAGAGTADGAVYSPVPLTVPQAAALHPAPCTLHVTVVFDVPTTDALSCCVPPVTTEVLLGVTVTTITGTMVTLAEAVLLGAAMLVAATVTLGGEGATDGAV